LSERGKVEEKGTKYKQTHFYQEGSWKLSSDNSNWPELNHRPKVGLFRNLFFLFLAALSPAKTNVTWLIWAKGQCYGWNVYPFQTSYWNLILNPVVRCEPIWGD
jgi:hypothetical protein